MPYHWKFAAIRCTIPIHKMYESDEAPDPQQYLEGWLKVQIRMAHSRQPEQTANNVRGKDADINSMIGSHLSK